jgi:hypothetical protein
MSWKCWYLGFCSSPKTWPAFSIELILLYSVETMKSTFSFTTIAVPARVHIILSPKVASQGKRRQ